MIRLYDGQINAIKRMHCGHILYGEVGSGKSRTSLIFFAAKICGATPAIPGYNDLTSNIPVIKKVKLYIITTAKKRNDNDWIKEMKECEFEDLGIDISEVVIDSWNNISKYSEVKDSFFIFDEQKLVGYGAWSKTFIKISKSNRWILLSGTPGDNFSDYMTVFIANGWYKNKSDFVRQHVVYKRYSSFPIIDYYIRTDTLERLRDEILVPMFVKRETQRNHIYMTVEYDCEMYKKTQKELWNPYLQKPLQNASELCQTLRHICQSPDARNNTVLDIFKKHKRAIIFYNYNYELDDLIILCEKNNIPYSQWNGHKHEPIPDTDEWLYLVQYTAGAEGWNCIISNCIIFYSENYSYKIMEQSCGRIDRVNTTYKDLYYYHIRTNSPIDNRIKKSLNNKAKFNESAFSKHIFEKREGKM